MDKILVKEDLIKILHGDIARLNKIDRSCPHDLFDTAIIITPIDIKKILLSYLEGNITPRVEQPPFL